MRNRESFQKRDEMREITKQSVDSQTFFGVQNHFFFLNNSFIIFGVYSKELST